MSALLFTLHRVQAAFTVMSSVFGVLCTEDAEMVSQLETATVQPVRTQPMHDLLEVDSK